MSSPNNDQTFRLTVDENETVLQHPAVMGARLAIPTEKVAKQYFQTTKKDSGLLPAVVRYVSPDFTGFIVERSPGRVRVPMKTSMSTGSASNFYEISVPWTLFQIKFHDTSYSSLDERYSGVYARNSSIVSEDDLVFQLPMPNIYLPSGRVCWGNKIKAELKELPEENTLYCAINKVINYFWQAGFNMDIYYFLLAPYLPEYFYDTIGKHDIIHDVGLAKKLMVQYFEILQDMPIDEVIEIEYRQAKNHHHPQDNLYVKNIMKILDGAHDKPDYSKTNAPFLTYIRALAMNAANDETQS
jgi:hypothetical protein